ncbi:MAG: pitrilysin family protein, partial [Actinomycetes bacterium]
MITEVIPGARSVALGVMVGAGSRYEDTSNQGAAHLLEHLLFRGAVSYDSTRLADLLDRMGGESNAVTDKEAMTAYVRTLPDEQAAAIALLGAVVTEPLLAEEVIDAERDVVLDEMLARDDEAIDLAQIAFDGACYGDHPLGRDVLGTVETLRSLDAPTVRSFHDATYGSDRTVVIATGAVNHDELVEQAAGSIRERRSTAQSQSSPTVSGASSKSIGHPGGQLHLL